MGKKCALIHKKKKGGRNAWEGIAEVSVGKLHGGNFSRPRQVSSESRSEIIIMGDKEKMSEVGISPSSILWPLTNETIAVRLQVASF